MLNIKRSSYDQSEVEWWKRKQTETKRLPELPIDRHNIHGCNQEKLYLICPTYYAYGSAEGVRCHQKYRML